MIERMSALFIGIHAEEDKNQNLIADYTDYIDYTDHTDKDGQFRFFNDCTISYLLSSSMLVTYQICVIPVISRKVFGAFSV